LKIGGMSDATVRLRRDHLRCIARRSKTQHPRALTLTVMMQVCDRRWSREHRKSVTSSLRSFCVWALDSGVLDVNPAVQLPKVRPQTPHPRPTPDSVWYQLLIDAAPRERLIARLAAEAGLRRAEIACCHRDDLLADGDRWGLIVHGKGDRQRVVPLTDSLAQAVIGHCEHGYLFPGSSPGSHITARWVGAMISH
jgi:integrase